SAPSGNGPGRCGMWAFAPRPVAPTAPRGARAASKGRRLKLAVVRRIGAGHTLATVHVPDNKVDLFLRKLEAYRDFNPEAPAGRENKKLVESISNIKLATLQELWTDDPELYPAPNTIITWEVWLRPSPDLPVPPLERLVTGAPNFGY